MVIKIDLRMAFGVAQLQELREAIKFFRSKGKLVIAVCDSFGEMQSGLAAYWLASACSHIFVCKWRLKEKQRNSERKKEQEGRKFIICFCLAPHGYVTINKLLIASPFLKSALSKLEVDAEFEHRREYKVKSNIFEKLLQKISYLEFFFLFICFRMHQICLQRRNSLQNTKRLPLHWLKISRRSSWQILQMTEILQRKK